MIKNNLNIPEGEPFFIDGRFNIQGYVEEPLQQTKSNRKYPVGTIFVYSIKEGEYIWGQIVQEVNWVTSKNGGADLNPKYLNRVWHIFNVVTTNYDVVPIDKLTKDNLLVPPCMSVKYEHFSKGIFLAVGHSDLIDRFDDYCYNYGFGFLDAKSVKCQLFKPRVTSMGFYPLAFITDYCLRYGPIMDREDIKLIFRF